MPTAPAVLSEQDSYDLFVQSTARPLLPLAVQAFFFQYQVIV